MPKREKQEVHYLEDIELEFISSGCTVLDCILGGGFPLKRISNIVGEKSVSKTGLGVELMKNFRIKYPEGLIAYQEVESAFDISYAKKLGLPIDDNVLLFEDIETVRDTYNNILHFIELVEKEKTTGLYVIDTLDAVKMDITPEMSEGYDGAKRAALINSMVTNLAGPIKRANVHLLVISQLRENIGVTFGEKYKRQGGKALDYYASLVIWLASTGKIEKTIRGIKKATGIKVKANCKKNKVGTPFRTCEFPVIFFYGMDNIVSNLNYLDSVKDGIKELPEDFFEKTADGKIDKEETIFQLKKNKNDPRILVLRNTVIKVYNEIENEFLPEFSKY